LEALLIEHYWQTVKVQVCSKCDVGVYRYSHKISIHGGLAP
jgi:hypothetical protein